MAETMVAASNIQHGDDKGNVKEFEVGDRVTGLPDDVMEELVENGSVVPKKELERREAPGTPSDLEEKLNADIKARDDEIAELKKKLAAAEKKANTPTTPQQGQQTPPANK
jgi:3-methyladenine DNA glycosylase/8-oxoguanine DNA glycosylase